MINKLQANKWRILPKVQYTNYRAEYNIGKDCFAKWFQVKRFWGGKIITVLIKHHEVQFDFRKNWIADMAFPDGGVK